MLSVLDDEQYRQLSAVAHSLNMGVLTEVSNEERAGARDCAGSQSGRH
jgi:indole-3-glycerol phosphate synthase